MKKLIVLFAAGIFTLNVFAQDQSSGITANANMNWKYKYCATMKNGKMKVMNEDKELMADATMTNGVKITTDGYVVKANGERTALKNGECVDNDGKIVTPKKDNMKKDKMSK
jgi:hypothetical protein